jgi:hypothetical protein
MDIAFSQDYTALAAVERRAVAEKLYEYRLGYLKQWPLGTSIVVIREDLRKLFAGPPLRGAVLALDKTSNQAVADTLREAQLGMVLKDITITAGEKITPERRGWHVAKGQLVSTLQVVLQTGRLKIVKCPERDLLLKQLEDFRVKITKAGSERFEALRESCHDDLVIAAGLAVWTGEHIGRREPACRPTTFAWPSNAYQQTRTVRGGIDYS